MTSSSLHFFFSFFLSLLLLSSSKYFLIISFIFFLLECFNPFFNFHFFFSAKIFSFSFMLSNLFLFLHLFSCFSLSAIISSFNILLFYPLSFSPKYEQHLQQSFCVIIKLKMFSVIFDSLLNSQKKLLCNISFLKNFKCTGK